MSESTNMKDLPPEAVRKTVAGHYASAVEAATAPESCCGSAPLDPANLDLTASADRLEILEHLDGEKWRAASGYTAEELADLPADAVQASFGCGNPVNLAGIEPGDTVVDLGSGAGIDVLLAAKRVGPTGHVIGIDMTEEMIAKAEANIAEAGLANAEIRRGLIEDLPVDSDAADWVISNCVINLSPEKPRVFAEMARVLKPGGRFLVSDIVVGDLPPYIRENVLGYVSCVGGAVGEDEYLRIIRDAGFAEARVVARHEYTTTELLGFAGCGDATELPSGESGDAIRQLLDQLEGKIVSVKVYGQKTA